MTNSLIESCVLLHSRLNHLVQIYTFVEHPSGSSTLVSASNPTMLDFAISGPHPPTQVHMEPMQYGKTGQEAYASRLGRSYMENDIHFYRLFSTCSNLSVHELVVYTHKLGAEPPTRSDLVIESFTHSSIRHTRRDVSKKEPIDEENDFIVPNGLKAVEGPKSKTMSQEPKRIQKRDRAPLRGGIDYRMLYSALIQPHISVDGATESVDIEVVTNQLQQILMDEPTSTPLPLGTL